MAWGGIRNLPPGFDATGGKGSGASIVDQVIKGDIPGLSPAQRDIFKDLKRHLLHQDYARYFETTVACASFLLDMPNRDHKAAVMKDIVEPALEVAVGQMEAIRKEVARYAATKRKMEYDPVSSLNQIHTKAKLVADAFPNAAGTPKIEPTYLAVLKEIQPTPGGGGPH